MQYTLLGRTGLRISRFCLGMENLYCHHLIDKDEALGLMNHAFDLGINFFNVAPDISDIMGRWLAQGDGRRDKTVLACLIGGGNQAPGQEGHSARHLRDSCDAYLRAFKTDYIDLLQLDHIRRETSWEEIWQAMEQLVQAGKVMYVGSANFTGWHITSANEKAAQRHFMGLVSEQSVYNLLQRHIELEVIPACAEYGLGIMPWSPLCSGLLAGALEPATEGRRSISWAREALERHRPKLESYEQYCSELELPPVGVSLAWLLHNPTVAAPIIGVRTTEQLDQIVNNLDITLTDDICQHLDDIFPPIGAGGPSPEAYAW